MPLSAVDAISPAFQHTKQQLLEPFKVAQWVKLAFVGLLAGELSSSGGCNTNFQAPHQGGIYKNFAGVSLPFHSGQMVAMVAFLIVIAVLFAIAMLYISSVMRFILFDSIVEKQCHIVQGWQRRTQEGFRYFVWKIVFLLASIALIGLLIAVPALLAFAFGWLKQPKDHLLPLVLGGIALFFIFLTVVVAFMLIAVFTKDFVVPQMALENIDAFQAWRRLLYMMNAEKGSYAIYVLMKIVMAIGAAVVIGIIALIVTLIIMIPVGGLGAIAVIAGKAAGMGWTPYTITLAVVFGVIAVGLVLYVISLISVPAIVFFPAYSLYFLAGRYPRLHALLHPTPPQPPPLLPPISPAGFAP